jgi:hypothetical protein
MGEAMRLRDLALIVVSGAILVGDGHSAVSADDRTEEVREIADAVLEAAEDLADLAKLLKERNRKPQAEVVLDDLEDLLTMAEQCCTELKTEADKAMQAAKVLLDQGKPREAQEALRRHAEVIAQREQVAKRLAELRTVHKLLTTSKARRTAPAALRGKPLSSWFAPRYGRDASEGAVADGLDWLSRHQSPDGFWDADNYAARCEEGDCCRGKGYALFDPGITGLALLAFLGEGHTHESGKYQDVIARGLRHLESIQDAEGCFGARTTNRFTYNHAIASLAMVEDYALTGSARFKRSAQAAVSFIEKCRNPYHAWRYGVKPQDNDTSVTGWMVMALRAAKEAGLDVPKRAFEGANQWVEKATEPQTGKVGYTARGTGPARPQDIMDKYPSEHSEALTAEGLMIRFCIGHSPRSEMVSKGASLCQHAPPRWSEASGSIDMYYWYYGSLAMYQIGKRSWSEWSRALRKALVPNQRREGCARGSWDPVGPWGREGGRVYSTAMCTLALQSSWRYGRLTGGR